MNIHTSSHNSITDGFPPETTQRVSPSVECTMENITPKIKMSNKQEQITSNKNEARSSNSNPLSWPSLWKNGPRRSAFHPYKPSREVCVPRPSSTTVMTNLQRGNIQAEAAQPSTDLSWFTLAGRGEISFQQLQDMLAQGRDINSVDEEGLSLLMWAAYHGQIHTVAMLLEVGGRTGIMTVGEAGMWGETALMLASTKGYLEIVRLLITAGADVNQQDHSGETALMCAVHGDHPHTVSELLTSGADPTIKNNKNCTAYDIAIYLMSLRSKAVLEKFMLSLLTGS